MGLALAAAIVIVGAITSYLAVPRHLALAGAAAEDRVLAELGPLIIGNYAVLCFFTLIVAAATWFRRRPEIHKRLMRVFALLGVGFGGSETGRALLRTWAQS